MRPGLQRTGEALVIKGVPYIPTDPMNEKAMRKPKNETQRESNSPIIIIIKLTKRPEIPW